MPLDYHDKILFLIYMSLWVMGLQTSTMAFLHGLIHTMGFNSSTHGLWHCQGTGRKIASTWESVHRHSVEAASGVTNVTSAHVPLERMLLFHITERRLGCVGQEERSFQQLASGLYHNIVGRNLCVSGMCIRNKNEYREAIGLNGQKRKD